MEEKAIVIITGLFVLYVIVSLFLFRAKLISLKADYENSLKSERADAVKKSKQVIRGQVSEQMIPIFPDFPYDVSECKFFGNPVDFIVFKGMGEVSRGEENAEIEVIIAEVKTGHAQPTKIQRAIKAAVKEGRFKFQTWRINEDLTIKIT